MNRETVDAEILQDRVQLQHQDEIRIVEALASLESRGWPEVQSWAGQVPL